MYNFKHWDYLSKTTEGLLFPKMHTSLGIKKKKISKFLDHPPRIELLQPSSPLLNRSTRISHFPPDWISRVSRIKRFVSRDLFIHLLGRLCGPGQKLAAAYGTGVIKPSSGSFQAVDTRRHAVLEEARKNRAPLVRWAKTKTETKSVTFAPAHANHRLNYSLTTYPPAFPKGCAP